MNHSDRLSVEGADEGARLDLFLSNKTGRSRNEIQRWIRKGYVRVDDQEAAKAGLRLKTGQIVSFSEPEPETWELTPQDLPLDIVYEDNHLIVVNKAPGMVVHPALGNRDGTLVNALLFHCHDLQGVGGVMRPGIVHRIDKDTSGLLVAAKHDDAHHGLADQFKAHSIRRRYRAIAFGQPDESSGTIEGNIARHKTDRKRFAVAEGRGKHAITHYRLAAAYGEVSLLELELETGRTHQIRVHLSHIGHPIVGDPVYCHSRRIAHVKNKPLQDRLRAIRRQMLHAAVLGFEHPINGQQMDFSADPPSDMQDLLDWLDAWVEASA